MIIAPNQIHDFLANFTSPHTRKAYQRDLGVFVAFVTQKRVMTPEVTQFGVTDIILFRDSLTNRSPATVNRMMSSVKSFLNWLVTRGVLATNPALSVKIPKPATLNPTLAFTDDEVRAVLEKPDVLTLSGQRHRLVLELLFNLGLRRSELVSLRFSDLRTDRGTPVLTILGKGGKVRTLPLTPPLHALVLAYKGRIKALDSDFIVKMNTASVYRIVTRYAKACGISRRVSPHSCRATVISHLLENQVSPRDVADFAGHASIQTTSIYDKKRDSLKNSAALKVSFHV